MNGLILSTMLPQSNHQQQDKITRAERLKSTIAALEARRNQLESEGEIAPPGCCVSRYQARGQLQAYWYYKLQATIPIFPMTQDEQKLSRYKHLGPAGSAAHVDGVIQVVRRVQIDELSKAINALHESWSDLYDSSGTTPCERAE